MTPSRSTRARWSRPAARPAARATDFTVPQRAAVAELVARQERSALDDAARAALRHYLRPRVRPPERA